MCISSVPLAGMAYTSTDRTNDGGVAVQTVAPRTPKRLAFVPFHCDMRPGSPHPTLYIGQKDAPQRQQDAEAPIRCLFCLQPVTNRNLMAEKDGRFVHRCTNPAGISFQIGIFLRAPGCNVSGPAEKQFSWFEGYAWRIAFCGNCRMHLGWRFESPGKDFFFGLILPHLSGI